MKNRREESQHSRPELQTWNNTQESDINRAYDSFLSIYIHLLNINCPLICQSINKTKPRCSPWITKGLINACKKKNQLYRKFIKQRTSESEIKYKTYKNKLTAVLRKCKKEYYQRLLEDNKNNVKGIWQVLNKVFQNKNKTGSTAKYYIHNGNTSANMNEVVNTFNNYIVSIGSKLAKEIVTNGNSPYCCPF